MISQTGISLETKYVLLIGLGLDAECGPLIGQIGLSLDPDWSLARVFNSNPSLPVGYTVEPLYNGHHWDPMNVRYSEVSLTRGLSVYFRWVWYCIIRLLNTMWLHFQSFPLLHAGREG